MASLETELIIAMAIGSTSLFGLLLVFLLLYTQYVSDSRRAHGSQSQEAPIQPSNVPEIQCHESTPQSHTDLSAPPRGFPQQAQYLPFNTPTPPPRGHQNQHLDSTRYPGPTYGPRGGHHERSWTTPPAPAGGHYPLRRPEAPTIPKTVLPLWRQNDELHFDDGHL